LFESAPVSAETAPAGKHTVGSRVSVSSAQSLTPPQSMTVPRSMREPPASLCARVVRGRSATAWSAPSPRLTIVLSRAGRRELVTSRRRVCARGYRECWRIPPVASVERPTATRTTSERRWRNITKADH